MSRFTYFAWSDQLDLMKIGKTDKPVDRMAKLAGKPRIVALAFSEDFPERLALAAFASFRKHGEWFDISERDVLRFLESESIALLDISKEGGKRAGKINVRLPDDVMARLVAAASKEDRSVSSWIRRACAEKLDRLPTQPQPQKQTA